MNLCVLTVAAHLVQQHSEEGVQLANHMEVSDCLVWCHACFPEFKTPRLRSSECTTPDFAVATAFVAGTGDCKDDF